jgi:hypothetical protein
VPTVSVLAEEGVSAISSGQTPHWTQCIFGGKALFFLIERTAFFTGGQALNNASNNGFPSPTWPYVGSGCNWNAPGANCTASKKLTGSFQGSGTE